MKKIIIMSIGLSIILWASFSRSRTSSCIVTDSITKLQWQDDTIGTRTTWQGAIDRCEALILGGYSDWRLPTRKELLSIVDDTKFNPSIYSTFVNTSTLNFYWSSTTTTNNSSNAWHIFFYYGGTNFYYKTNTNYVRCVRAGQ